MIPTSIVFDKEGNLFSGTTTAGLFRNFSFAKPGKPTLISPQSNDSVLIFIRGKLHAPI
jgi:hypothetical protein